MINLDQKYESYVRNGEKKLRIDDRIGGKLCALIFSNRILDEFSQKIDFWGLNMSFFLKILNP